MNLFQEEEDARSENDMEFEYDEEEDENANFLAGCKVKPHVAVLTIIKLTKREMRLTWWLSS